MCKELISLWSRCTKPGQKYFSAPLSHPSAAAGGTLGDETHSPCKSKCHLDRVKDTHICHSQLSLSLCIRVSKIARAKKRRSKFQL